MLTNFNIALNLTNYNKYCGYPYIDIDYIAAM